MARIWPKISLYNLSQTKSSCLSGSVRDGWKPSIQNVTLKYTEFKNPEKVSFNMWTKRSTFTFWVKMPKMAHFSEFLKKLVVKQHYQTGQCLTGQKLVENAKCDIFKHYEHYCENATFWVICRQCADFLKVEKVIPDKFTQIARFARNLS